MVIHAIYAKTTTENCFSKRYKEHCYGISKFRFKRMKIRNLRIAIYRPELRSRELLPDKYILYAFCRKKLQDITYLVL